ncbi:MarR family EPS-associated transcriptional regulator [Desulfoferrobacter suflitae]|uniref:MarR family EPS-associated transcriptional regulator n=1 Tax=Desulfoferrobacter suflitae TaxID=2865782 RepID=UPI0021648AC6|nr:MarR family EPS-associated transcriptional regulator [Desulfoferrobacter suflitae]MCK8602284.1 MarR family EPS-associated transcriptional regulator [Desulfoferrobacter suflitae]
MDAHYLILKTLNETPNISQRLLAEKMGISLGKVNFCLNELARKGWIKVDRFKNSQNKMGYAYFLTPRGLEEKARLTVHFLRRKAEEYELIRQQIDELHQELEKERQSVQNT